MAPRRRSAPPRRAPPAAPDGRARARRIAVIRAGQTLQREYGALRGSTLRAVGGKLRASNVPFDPSDLEDHYNDAWRVLHHKLATDDPVANLGGFLTQTAYYRAVDRFRRERPDRRTDALDNASTEDDVAAAIDDAALLRAFMQGLRGRLHGRELQAATLCYLHGYARSDAAALLGLSPTQMKKTMGHAAPQVTRLLEDLRAGDWCTTQRSVITAYGLRVLDPHGIRASIAKAHLKGCSACRARVRDLRAGAASP